MRSSTVCTGTTPTPQTAEIARWCLSYMKSIFNGAGYLKADNRGSGGRVTQAYARLALIARSLSRRPNGGQTAVSVTLAMSPLYDRPSRSQHGCEVFLRVLETSLIRGSIAVTNVWLMGLDDQQRNVQTMPTFNGGRYSFTAARCSSLSSIQLVIQCEDGAFSGKDRYDGGRNGFDLNGLFDTLGLSDDGKNLPATAITIGYSQPNYATAAFTISRYRHIRTDRSSRWNWRVVVAGLERAGRRWRYRHAAGKPMVATYWCPGWRAGMPECGRHRCEPFQLYGHLGRMISR